MIFRRPIFDARLQDHGGRAFARDRFLRFVEDFLHVPQRNAQLLFESHRAFENRRRSGHPGARQERCIHPESGGIRKGHAFPVRKLPHPRLPKRRAMHARDIDRVPGPLRIELHQFRAGQRGRERAIRGMIPATRPNTRGIAEPALHFISDRRRHDHLLAGRADAFPDREHGREVVAWMRRLLREISVVVIEIADLAAVRERGPIRRGLVRGSENGRAVFRREIGNDRARDRARFLVPCAQRAAQRIHQPPFHLVDNVLRKVLEIQGAGEVGELVRESRISHRKVKLQSGD